jgi:hypothetical protein
LLNLTHIPKPALVKMFFDLFLPFPVAEQDPMPKKKKDKGKNKLIPSVAVEVVKKSCWEGLTGQEKDGIAKDIALAGHCKLMSTLTLESL